MACSVAGGEALVAHPGGGVLEGAVVAQRGIGVREAGQHGQRAVLPGGGVLRPGLVELANGSASA